LLSPGGTSTLGTIGGLSDTEYAVLGLLTHGERSGYELDKLAQRSIGYFWRPAKSKIYAILPRLVERGLAVSAAVAQNRRPDKQLYRITAAGEQALRRWLDSPEPVAGVARDGLLLKLFFGGYGDVDSLREQVAERKRAAEQKLSELEAIERTIDTDVDFFPYLTLLHGLRQSRSTIAWADEVLVMLDRKTSGSEKRARA
jgi:DNA-binding PadR family transcriptional regulator